MQSERLAEGGKAPALPVGLHRHWMLFTYLSQFWLKHCQDKANTVCGGHRHCFT